MVLVVAAVYRQEVDRGAFAAVEADINVFRADVEGAQVEEPRVSVYAAAAGSVGGVC